MKAVARMLPFLGGALLAVAPVAQGQSITDLSPGARVRVAEQGTRALVGTVTAVRGDTLLMLAGGEVHVLPISPMLSLQVSRGRPPRVASMLEGGAIGLLAGAIGGAASLAISSLVIPDSCDREGDGLLCLSAGEWALVGVAIGAPVGGASGAVVGLISPRERWRRVESAGNVPRLTVHTGTGGLRIGFSVPTS